MKTSNVQLSTLNIRQARWQRSRLHVECSMNVGCWPRAGGFTLIELLLGIAITAIVLVAINAVFFTSLRLRDRTTNYVEESLPVQQTLAIVRRDLQGALPPGGILSGTFRAGELTSLDLNLPVNIEFNTTTGVLRDSEPWGDVQKVAYSLRLSSDRGVAGSDLYRSVTRNLLATIPPAPEEQWMLGGVESLEFACYDGSQWRNEWDTSSTDTNLPSAVRVTIVLASHDARFEPRQLEMIVPISSQSHRNTAGAAQ